MLISTLGKAGLKAGAPGEDQQSLVGSENDEEGGAAGKGETSTEGSKVRTRAPVLQQGTITYVLYILF